MPLVSKTVEVTAPAAAIMSIVADFEAYPEWTELPVVGVDRHVRASFARRELHVVDALLVESREPREEHGDFAGHDHVSSCRLQLEVDPGIAAEG